MRIARVLCLLSASGAGLACNSHASDKEWTQAELDELELKWGTDWGFSGIVTFAHLEHVRCLTQPGTGFDIGIVGAPFDTAVSYRPGARFGPRAIREASARQTSFRGFNARAGINPYASWARVLDCGDIPVVPFDNAVAVRQMEAAFAELGGRTAVSSLAARPRLITLGGDHSLALPALRALHAVHGPVRVLHFDAHLDTWHPAKYPSAWPSQRAPGEAHDQAHFNHGSMFWLAGREGLLRNDSAAPSMHAGLRTRLSGTDWADWEDDAAQNWVRLTADDIDDLGPRGIADHILRTLGTQDPVYLSIDIDVLDPAFAPGTGTPEPGGWSTRELIRILRALEDLNLVGADVVEVSPAYQNAGQETALAAAQIVYEVLTSMVKKGLKDVGQAAAAAAPPGHDEL